MRLSRPLFNFSEVAHRYTTNQMIIKVASLLHHNFELLRKSLKAKASKLLRKIFKIQIIKVENESKIIE